jgi:N-acetylmuramic acid 6-phosphate etherase
MVYSYSFRVKETILPDTENQNRASKGIDALSVIDVLKLMHREDTNALDAVGTSLANIERAVHDAVRTIRSGGRVLYIGAGTSGRLGVLDAAEIQPTFGSDRFRAIIAGGERAVTRAVEGAEDDEAAARNAVAEIRAGDMAVGISASGGTPFVVGALKESNKSGALCWLITCNKIEKPPFLDGMVVLDTGPELVAGSTRLKAATATKLALNMLSTATMISLGGVYDGLMVDVVPSNKKLIERAEGIVMQITGCGREEASKLLKESGMKSKTAALMKIKGISRSEAERLLEEAGGSLRQALDT